MSQYEDRMTIDTPEGVSMTVGLAGVGSRFVAAGVDVTIQLTLLGAAAVLFEVPALPGRPPAARSRSRLS